MVTSVDLGFRASVHPRMAPRRERLGTHGVFRLRGRSRRDRRLAHFHQGLLKTAALLPPRLGPVAFALGRKLWSRNPRTRPVRASVRNHLDARDCRDVRSRLARRPLASRWRDLEAGLAFDFQLAGAGLSTCDRRARAPPKKLTPPAPFPHEMANLAVAVARILTPIER